MTEIIDHLRLQKHGDKILAACTCIPCMMPFITSQFLPRSKGDHPQVTAGRFQEPGLRRAVLRTPGRFGALGRASQREPSLA